MDGTGADTVIPFSLSKTISIKLNLSCSVTYAVSNNTYLLFMTGVNASVQINNKSVLTASVSRSDLNENGYSTVKTTNYIV